MYTIKYVRQSGSHHFTVTNEREQVCRVSIWPNADGTLAATLGSFGGQVWPCSFPELFAMESGKPSAQHPLQVELTPLAQAEFAAALPPSAQEVENIFAILDNPAHTAEEWDAACLAIWAPLADEPAETPLTPSQLEAEALADLQAIALECDMAIRQHIANDGHLTDKANKDARLIRAEARRIVAGFTTWLDRDALRAA